MYVERYGMDNHGALDAVMRQDSDNEVVPDRRLNIQEPEINRVLNDQSQSSLSNSVVEEPPKLPPNFGSAGLHQFDHSHSHGHKIEMFTHGEQQKKKEEIDFNIREDHHAAGPSKSEAADHSDDNDSLFVTLPERRQFGPRS